MGPVIVTYNIIVITGVYRLAGEYGGHWLSYYIRVHIASHWLIRVRAALSTATIECHAWGVRYGRQQYQHGDTGWSPFAIGQVTGHYAIGGYYYEVGHHAVTRRGALSISILLRWLRHRSSLVINTGTGGAVTSLRGAYHIGVAGCH